MTKLTDGGWYFSNLQWTVTDDGIEPSAGVPYSTIPASRLLEIRESPHEHYYDWPLHMEEKEWVDMAMFTSAWLAAINHFHRDSIDFELVAHTIRKALSRRIWAYEEMLGMAAEKTAGYYDKRITMLTIADLGDRDEAERKAAEKWREHTYAYPKREDDGKPDIYF